MPNEGTGTARLLHLQDMWCCSTYIQHLLQISLHMFERNVATMHACWDTSSAMLLLAPYRPAG